MKLLIKKKQYLDNIANHALMRCYDNKMHLKKIPMSASMLTTFWNRANIFVIDKIVLLILSSL